MEIKGDGNVHIQPLGPYMDVFRRLCYQTRWGLLKDVSDAESADFLYEVVNVFVPLQHRICGFN